MFAWVDSRARAPRRRVERWRWCKGTCSVLLFTFGMLFPRSPDTFLSRYVFASWLRNIAQLHVSDGDRARGAMPGCIFCVVSAATWPPKKKPEEQTTEKVESPQEGTERHEQPAKQQEQPQPNEQVQRPTNLFRETTTTLQHLLHSADALQSLRLGTMRLQSRVDTPNPTHGRVDDRPFPSQDGGAKHAGPFQCDMHRVTGCQGNSDVMPFPILSMLASSSHDYPCSRPVEDDFGDEESDDEFRAASLDESAAPCLPPACPNVRRSWSILEPLENTGATSLYSPHSEYSARSLIGRKSTASLPGKLSPRIAGNTFSFLRQKPTGAGERVGRTLERMSSADLVHPDLFAPYEDSSEDEEMSQDAGAWASAGPDEGSKDDSRVPDVVDGPIPGVEPVVRGATRTTDFHLQGEGLLEAEAVAWYQNSKDQFRTQTNDYVVRLNQYCTLEVTSFEMHPSGCAKHNLASLVESVGNENSLLHAHHLSYLLHFVVHVLWRGIQLVAVVYPSYIYSLGRSEATVRRLPHFMRIVEESLAVIAREPEGQEAQRQRWNAACKAQSAASQGESALGAVASVVTSGMTTAPSQLVDVIKMGDLLSDIAKIPLVTGRLLLLLADLCRTGFEMSEPLAQSIFCQEEAPHRPVKVDPALEESMAYCKAETVKFSERYEEAQETAKNVAQQALVIYNKLMLLDVLPKRRRRSSAATNWD